MLVDLCAVKLASSNDIVQYLATGNWSGNAPTCQGMYVYKLTFSYPMVMHFGVVG